MKYIILASLLTLPIVGYAEQSNVITFQGQVDDVTCSVSINGSDSSPIVLLQTAKKTDLATAGATAIPTEFTLQLTDCGAAKTATASLVGNNVTTNGNLGNTGTAANVSIQILDKGTPIVFSGSSAVTAGSGTALTDGSGTMPFVAQYYAETAEVTAGSVQATMQYAITYQ